MPLNLVIYTELLYIYYNNTPASYFSEKKTLNLFLYKYYWLSINANIINYIFAYNLC